MSFLARALRILGPRPGANRDAIQALDDAETVLSVGERAKTVATRILLAVLGASILLPQGTTTQPVQSAPPAQQQLQTSPTDLAALLLIHDFLEHRHHCHEHHSHHTSPNLEFKEKLDAACRSLGDSAGPTDTAGESDSENPVVIQGSPTGIPEVPIETDQAIETLHAGSLMCPAAK